LELREALVEKEAALKIRSAAVATGSQDSVRRPGPPKVHADYQKELQASLRAEALQPPQLRGTSTSGASLAVAASGQEGPGQEGPEVGMHELALCEWRATMAKLGRSLLSQHCKML